MTSDTRICIMIPCLNTGGTEMQTLNLLRVLKSCGYTVEVICYFEYDNSIVEEFQKACSKVKLLEMNRETSPFRLILNLRKEIRSIRPDIVHVQYMSPGALPIIAARLAGVKTVFATVHQPYTKSHGIFAKIILRAASLLTTRFMAVSLHAEKGWFGSSSLFQENKDVRSQSHHFTIYNSVDTDRITRIVSETDPILLKKKAGVKLGIPVIGTVSRLRHEKGVDILIEAFSILLKERINAFLIIAGSGPDEEKLKNQALASGISGMVIFYGPVNWEKAIRLFTIMDIVVVPSRFEGFGLTAAEAMAAERPVIASDCYGLNEVVINNKTGFTFSSNHPEDLAGKLKYMISNPERFKQLAINGKSRAKTMFGPDVFRNRILSLYNSTSTN